MWWFVSFFTSVVDVYFVTHSTYHGFPELRHGNRAVRISLSKNVPGAFQTLDGLRCRCHQPGYHQASSCRNGWAISFPAVPAASAPTAPAPAALAPAAVSVGAADVSAADLPGAVDVSAVAEVEMSDKDFVQSLLDVESDMLVSIDEVASGN